MNILITGGAGFIGSHTAKYLAQNGLQPVVIDNLVTGHAEVVQWGPLIQCDIADKDVVRRVLDEYSIEAVLHFAAHCYVGESLGNPSKYFANNVTNTLKFLDTICTSGVKHFVFSSSCATYGVPNRLPITESTLQLPINPYGESKLFVERALKWYGQAYGLKWVALRYFNAAGADPDGQLGELHDPETHLIPAVIQAALGHAPELEIYGTDYPTPDGSAVRDYVHVSDLASAHLQALNYLRGDGPSGAFNIGAGQGHSIFEVIKEVETITNRRVPARTVARRDGDPPILVADVQRAREVLGWTPVFSTLENIVLTAHRWHTRTAQKSASF